MATNFQVIIPAAGMGRRMKSYGPKALIPLHNGETVLSRQIKLVRSVYGQVEIIVVAGFEAEKIRKAVDYKVKVVYNYDFETTNVARSIHIGLSISKCNHTLIVYGDLVFNTNALIPCTSGSSRVLVDSRGRFGKTEVGVTVIDGKISTFSYGLPVKWGQIVYLQGKEIELFKKLLSDKKTVKFFGFEILNAMLNNGCALQAIEPQGLQIAEIDTSKDIEIARRIAI
jgi:choline kinase